MSGWAFHLVALCANEWQKKRSKSKTPSSSNLSAGDKGADKRTDLSIIELLCKIRCIETFIVQRVSSVRCL